jgi:hypothetical protein
MPAGSSITFAVNVNVDTSATSTISDSATVIPPLGQSDPNGANNEATDTLTVGT